MLAKLSHYLIRFVEVFSCVLLFCLAMTMLIGISDRFLFHFGFSWPEELARFLFIWLGPLTAALLVKKREHFDFPIIVDKLFVEGTKGRLIYEILLSGTMVGLMILLFIFGIKFVLFAKFHHASALSISMSYVYMSIPVGTAFIIFFYMVNIYDDIKKITKLLIN